MFVFFLSPAISCPMFLGERGNRTCKSRLVPSCLISLSSFFTQNTATKENETLLAIGTAYVQGEDVAARGRVLLFSVGKNSDNLQNLVIYLNLQNFLH